MAAWINSGTEGAQIRTPRPLYTRPVTAFVGNARAPGSAANNHFSGVQYQGVASVPDYTAGAFGSVAGGAFERIGTAGTIMPAAWSYGSGSSGGAYPLDHSGRPISRFPGVQVPGIRSVGGAGVPLSQQGIRLMRIHNKIGKGSEYAHGCALYIHTHAG